MARSFLPSGRNPRASIMLVGDNRLDVELLSKLLTVSKKFRLALATDNLDDAVHRLRGICPEVVVVDPAVHVDSIKRLSEALGACPRGHLFVLDRRLREGCLQECLKTISTSYYTRSAGVDQIEEAILHVAARGERLFCPTLGDRVLRTSTWLLLRTDPRKPSIASLTARELQVMRLISEGYTVRECAQQLSLSESTIDNHKARLMKKLRLKKSQQLTRRAISDGLISE